MKKSKKLLSVILTTCIVFSPITSTFANENSSAKEEVIYIMANSDGSVKDIYVVNIFSGGEITDYGNYSEVKMLTTDDPISVKDDSITFSSTSEKVYYQGKMQDKQIPWDISINYYLDNQEYTPNEIAGRSGNLKIKLKIYKNDNYEGTLYDYFTLQTTLLFDTTKASNIIAEGSTIVNVGKNKQILYTVLPGENLDVEIFANVVDFEMDAIEVNGISMNLNIDVDTSSIMSEFDEFQDGITELNNGAIQLRDGSSDLRTATSTLNDGVKKLGAGTTELSNSIVLLSNGISSLQEGIGEIQNGLSTLNDKSDEIISGSTQFNSGLKEIQEALSNVSATANDISQLTSASLQIKEGIEELSRGMNHENVGSSKYKSTMKQNGLDVDELKEMNSQAINTLNDQIRTLQNNISAIQEVEGQEQNVIQLQRQIEQLSNVIKLMSANNEAINGTESYLNTLEASMSQLVKGVSDLETKYGSFNDGIQNLSSSLSGMVYNIRALSDGINKLVSEYSKLDSGFVEYSQGVKSLVDGFQRISDGISEISNGSKQLKTGSDEISTNMNKLLSGVSELYNGTDELYKGSVKLSNGVAELKDRTSNLDTRIEDKVNEMLSDFRGDKGELKSFTSSKNTNIKSVQFVYKIDAIEKPESVNEVTNVEENFNFWQKLMRLFRLN